MSSPRPESKGSKGRRQRRLPPIKPAEPADGGVVFVKVEQLKGGRRTSVVTSPPPSTPSGEEVKPAAAQSRFSKAIRTTIQAGIWKRAVRGAKEAPEPEPAPSRVSRRKPNAGWRAVRGAVKQEHGQDKYAFDSRDVLKEADLKMARKGSNASSAGSAAMGGSKASIRSLAGPRDSARGSFWGAKGLLGNRMNDLDQLVRAGKKAGIDPEAPLATGWRLGAVVAIVVQVVLAAFRWGFGDPACFTDLTGILLIAVDLVYVVDVFMKTRLGFVHHGNKIVNRDLIMRHYVSSAEFPLDVSAAFPWELVALATGGSFWWARIPKLLRFVYVPGRLRSLEGVAMVSTTLMRLFKTLLYLGLVSHYVGCLWFVVGKSEGFGTNAFVPSLALSRASVDRQYLHALYFGHGVLTGLVEIPEPVTEIEQVFTAVVTFVGVFVVAYLIASVNGILSQVDVNKLRYRATLNRVNHFMSYHRLPRRLHERIIDYHRFMFAEYGGFDESAILSVLPKTLQSDISVFLTREIVSTVYVLRGVEDGFLASLVTYLRPWLVTYGEYVVKAGQVVTAMYFVHWGELEEEIEVHVEGRVESELLVVRLLGAGDYLGDYELLNSTPAMYAYRANSFSHLYVLTKATFERLLEHFPQTLTAMNINAARGRRQRERGETVLLKRASVEYGLMTRVDPEQANKEPVKGRLSTKNESTKKRRRRSQIMLVGAAIAKTEEAADTRVGHFQKAVTAHGQTLAGPAGATHLATNFVQLFDCGVRWRLQRAAQRCAGRSVAKQHRALSKRDKRQLVIHPDSDFRKRWILLLMAITLISLFVTPIRVAFASDLADPGVMGLDYFGDLVFLFEIYFNLRLAFHHRGQLVVELPRIRARFQESGALLLHLLAAAPLDLVMLWTGMNPALRLNKLLRMFFLQQWFEEVAKKSFRYGLLRLIKMVFVLVASVHFVSCAYFTFTFVEGFSTEEHKWLPHESLRDAPVSQQYARSLYFALKPRGLGRDLKPSATSSTCFGLVVMVYGVYLYAFLIGNIGALLNSVDVNAAEFRRRKHVVDLFMTSRRLPQGLQARVSAFFDVWWASHEGVEPKDVVAELPAALQTQVMYALCGENVKRVPFFADCNDAFVTDLCKRLRAEVVPQGEVIMREGDVGDRMYFLASGAVDVMRAEDVLVAAADASGVQAPYKTVGPGSFFGEGAFFHGLRSATVRARTACEMFVLTHDALEEVITPYPSLVVRLELLANRRRAKIRRQRENVLTFAKMIGGNRDTNRFGAPGGAAGGPRVRATAGSGGGGGDADSKTDPASTPASPVAGDGKGSPSGTPASPGAGDSKDDKAGPGEGDDAPEMPRTSMFGFVLAQAKMRRWLRANREKAAAAKHAEVKGNVDSLGAQLKGVMGLKRALRRVRERKEAPVGGNKYMPTEAEVAAMVMATQDDDDEEMRNVDQLLETPFALGKGDLMQLLKAKDSRDLDDSERQLPGRKGSTPGTARAGASGDADGGGDGGGDGDSDSDIGDLDGLVGDGDAVGDYEEQARLQEEAIKDVAAATLERRRRGRRGSGGGGGLDGTGTMSTGRTSRNSMEASPAPVPRVSGASGSGSVVAAAEAALAGDADADTKAERPHGGEGGGASGGAGPPAALQSDADLLAGQLGSFYRDAGAGAAGSPTAARGDNPAHLVGMGRPLSSSPTSDSVDRPSPNALARGPSTGTGGRASAAGSSQSVLPGAPAASLVSGELDAKAERRAGGGAPGSVAVQMGDLPTAKLTPRSLIASRAASKGKLTSKSSRLADLSDHDLLEGLGVHDSVDLLDFAESVRASGRLNIEGADTGLAAVGREPRSAIMSAVLERIESKREMGGGASGGAGGGAGGDRKEPLSLSKLSATASFSKGSQRTFGHVLTAGQRAGPLVLGRRAPKSPATGGGGAGFGVRHVSPAGAGGADVRGSAASVASPRGGAGGAGPPSRRLPASLVQGVEESLVMATMFGMDDPEPAEVDAAGYGQGGGEAASGPPKHVRRSYAVDDSELVDANTLVASVRLRANSLA